MKQKITVSKRVLRRLIGKKRIPAKFGMLVPGSLLYDLLRSKRLNNEIMLWGLTYWVRIRSVNPKQAAVTWEEEKPHLKGDKIKF